MCEKSQNHYVTISNRLKNIVYSSVHAQHPLSRGPANFQSWWCSATHLWSFETIISMEIIACRRRPRDKKEDGVLFPCALDILEFVGGRKFEILCQFWLIAACTFGEFTFEKWSIEEAVKNLLPLTVWSISI